MSLTVGSLFAGIGGFDLGFERAGCRVRWQVEIDPWARRVLERHFPAARRYQDVREVGARNLEPVDIICGGFPCQDISNAGQRAGIEGERSGLWREMWRITSELRPRYLVVENVAALLGRGMERVIGDLAEIRYDAEWDVISAADVGAPHLRERIWIVAYPDRQQSERAGIARSMDGAPSSVGEETWKQRVRDAAWSGSEDVADDSQHRRGPGRTRGLDPSGSRESEQPLSVMADADISRLQGRQRRIVQERAGEWVTGPSGTHGTHAGDGREFWRVEPSVGRVAHGVSRRVDRLRGLGNAVVPQIPEWIARRILAAEGRG